MPESAAAGDRVETGLLALAPEGGLIRASITHKHRTIHCSTNAGMVCLGIAMRLPLPTPIATVFSPVVVAAHPTVGAAEIEPIHPYN